MARMARLRFMKLAELLNAANQGYPDGYLAEYYGFQNWDPEVWTTRYSCRVHCFAELIDTFDSETNDDAQIGIATQMLEGARKDLLDVI